MCCLSVRRNIFESATHARWHLETLEKGDRSAIAGLQHRHASTYVL